MSSYCYESCFQESKTNLFANNRHNIRICSFVLIARISAILLLHFSHSGLIPPDAVNTNGTKVVFSTKMRNLSANFSNFSLSLPTDIILDQIESKCLGLLF